MKLPIFFVALFLFIHTAFSQTPPTLFTPTNGATNQAISVTLDWSSVSGNTGYPYQIDTVSTFDSPQLISNTTATNISEVTINGLSFGTTYYWRVKTQTATGTSDWSTVFNFTTANSITLFTPTNGTTDQPIALTLDWSSLTGNTGYKYQYDTVNTFDSPNLVTNTTVANSSEIYISNLAFNTTYYWRVAVLGSTGQSGWSSVFNFKTANNITLYTPTNGTIDQPIALTLDWSSLAGNTGYKYQYDTVNTFDSPNLVTNTTVANSSEIYISNLAFNTTYYWRVAVLGATGQSGWSTVFNFKTANNITLYTPTNGTIDQPIALTLDWSSLTGNTGYKYQYDTVNTFDSPNLVTNTTVANSSEIYISNLAFNTTYYWRVAVLGSTGQSGWSSVFNFKTANNITLYTPTNGTIDQPIALTLDWSSLAGNTGYKYQYDTVNTFDSPNLVTNTTVANSSEIYISNLAFNTTYYWRVAVLGSTGQSDWSTVFSFTTGNQVTLYTPVNGAINQTTTVTLDWSSFTGNNGYVYQLDTQPSFDSPNFQTGNLGANISQVTINGLTLNQTYYWRVAIRNTYSQSAWSNVWAFATGASLSNDTAWIGNIQIFPNPVIEVLKIQLPENTTPLSYFLFNAYGQMLQQGIIESSQATISLSKFPSGVYFLRLENPLKKVHFNTTLVKE